MKKLFFTLFFVFLWACSPQTENPQSADIIYVCPMHAQVQSQKMGICPICKMDLVPKHLGENLDIVSLMPEQMDLLDLQTDTAREIHFSRDLVLAGKILYDPDLSLAVVAKAAGRIEQLKVKTPYQKVKKGEPLLLLYSEDVLVLQQDYLQFMQNQYLHSNMYRSVRFQALERNLMLYGFSAQDLKKLISRAEPLPYLSIKSPQDATVLEILKKEGDYVQEGEKIFSLGGLDTFWVQAFAYNLDQNFLQSIKDLSATIYASDYSAHYPAEILYKNPNSNSGAGIELILRLSLPQARLGEQVYVRIAKNEGKQLAIAKTALNGTSVWVQNPDNPLEFAKRTIQTGAENDTHVVVIDGLSPGDIVVTKGSWAFGNSPQA
jgi:Cu(I)/Ag(I) efflux system membrane fusion protein